MSSRHSRLSKGIEAFISRITAAGPSAKRPPHMALEVSLRALIPFLLVATLMVGGCDRAKPGAEQASGALADAKIGRAHVCTPVTNAQLVCRLLLEKKNTNNSR